MGDSEYMLAQLEGFRKIELRGVYVRIKSNNDR